MKTQLEWLEYAVAMAKAYPLFDIHVCVDGDLVNEYGWTQHKISHVTISDWITIGDTIYDDLENAIGELLDTTDEPEREIRSRLKDHKAILIYTNSSKD